MAPLTILTDGDVRSLLRSLSHEDVTTMQTSLAEALHTYSTGTQEDYACSVNQPDRTAITLRHGTTTLFMPASTADTTGVKTVTISEQTFRQCQASSATPISSTTGPSSASSFSTSNSTSASTTSLPSPSPSSTSINTPTTPASSIASDQSTTPRGSLTILSHTGSPLGLLAAEELTAFRTALAATLLLKKREHVSTITVFGAGKQAYWHIRLALLLRGADIHRVNIINRTFARAQPLLQDFHTSGLVGKHTKMSILSAEYVEYERLLKEEVRKADVIFCCTPSLTPLFPAEHLTATEGRKKGRLVSAIGSYKPHMLELHPDILRQATAPHHAHHHHHKHAQNSGVVVVDSLSATLKEAGEVVQAGLGPQQLVEVGELVMLKKQAMKGNGGKQDVAVGGGKGEKGGLTDWLSKGNVIYKSVGLGLMDLTVGMDLVRLAGEKGVGTRVPDF